MGSWKGDIRAIFPQVASRCGAPSLAQQPWQSCCMELPLEGRADVITEFLEQGKRGALHGV